MIHMKIVAKNEKCLQKMIGLLLGLYSQTCVKRPLKNRQNKDLNDKW